MLLALAGSRSLALGFRLLVVAPVGTTQVCTKYNLLDTDKAKTDESENHYYIIKQIVAKRRGRGKKVLRTRKYTLLTTLYQ